MQYPSRDQQWFGSGVAVLFVMSIVTGGLYYFQSKTVLNPAEQAKVASPSREQPSASASATAKPSYQVQILNGSGVVGAASSAAASLSAQASDAWLTTTTGNAAASSGTKVIYSSEELKRSYLADTISKMWSSAKVSVDPSLKDSVKIIIGK